MADGATVINFTAIFLPLPLIMTYSLNTVQCSRTVCVNTWSFSLFVGQCTWHRRHFDVCLAFEPWSVASRFKFALKMSVGTSSWSSLAIYPKSKEPITTAYQLIPNLPKILQPITTTSTTWGGYHMIHPLTIDYMVTPWTLYFPSNRVNTCIGCLPDIFTDSLMRVCFRENLVTETITIVTAFAVSMHVKLLCRVPYH